MMMIALLPMLTQSAREAQKGMLDHDHAVATELHKLRGLPKAIQTQFEEHQKAATGTDE